MSGFFVHPLQAESPLQAGSRTRNFQADLSASGETAVVHSPATGTANLTLEIPEHRLRWKVTFHDLSSKPVGIGLHGPVEPGSNGLIMVELASANANSPTEGSAILNDAQVEYMLSGWTYVDIRTAQHPTGEIRGQVRVLPPSRSESRERSNTIRPANEKSVRTRGRNSLASAWQVPGRADETKRLGFVITWFRTAIYETKYMDECPEGLAISNDQIWWLSTDPEVRAHVTNNGEIEPVRAPRHNVTSRRGPNGEDVCWNPDVVQDPPHKTVTGKISYGMNLDGTSDGAASRSTCAHENFTSPDGVQGVDNQAYRLLGCIYGWRRHGFHEPRADVERRDTSRGIILIEITGVDDLNTDDHVEVGFYRAIDVVAKDAAGNMLPYASYRIDDPQRYGALAKGQIRDGVLSTEPVDAHLPYRSNNAQGEMYIKSMRMELRPSEDGQGVAGLLAGYHDLDNWWDFIRKTAYLVVDSKFSCPALYDAAHRLADGFPDPETGQCTALSSAYKFEAIPAFIIRPGSPPAAAMK